MRKILALVLISSLIVSNVGAATLQEIKNDYGILKENTLLKYKDINETDWYIKNVTLLSELGIIKGYEDGTFRANNTITRAQFIKMIVAALGNDNLPMGDLYWASTYINKAYELNLIEKEEVSQVNFDKPITRQEMAAIAANSIKETFDTSLTKYKDRIKDINSTGEKYKESILKVYIKGIITGYADGEFKPLKSATRAEGATIIIRLLDLDERLYVDTFNDTLLDKKEILRLQEFPKASDEAYTAIIFDNLAVDFGVLSKTDMDTIEKSYILVKEFLKNNQKKYNLKDIEFYTNRDLAYTTKKGIVRIRGIIDGANQEVELATLKETGQYVIAKIRELK